MLYYTHQEHNAKDSFFLPATIGSIFLPYIENLQAAAIFRSCPLPIKKYFDKHQYLLSSSSCRTSAQLYCRENERESFVSSTWDNHFQI